MENLVEHPVAFQEGYSAAKAFDLSFFPEQKNPYERHTPNHENWGKGWGDYFHHRNEVMKNPYHSSPE